MIKRFLSQFYLLTDAPSETEKYVERFTPEASVTIGARSIQGREGNHQSSLTFNSADHL